MNNNLIQILNEFGLHKEKGVANGGWYTPEEVGDNLRVYGLELIAYDVLAPFVKKIENDGRAHELIHCLNVGLGSVELVEQVAKDRKAQEMLGLSPEMFTSDYVEAIFLSGLFHDMILGFKGSELVNATPESAIESRVVKGEVPKFKGKAQYIKDVVGDDLRGAILLDRYGISLAEHIRIMAAGELLNGSDLQVIETGKNLLGDFVAYKVLDAIWYHDGNYPIRGHAEADALLGDRVRLYTQGRVGIDVVEAGIKKLLGYTERDPEWVGRSEQVDIEYLRKMITKKAGNFLETITGTETYEFVVDNLTARGRSNRALQCPALWRGVDKIPVVLQRLESVPELREAFGPQIETLHRRYEEAMQYKPGDIK